MSRLRSIVYFSTAVGEHNPATLEALLLEARTLNTKNEVTGVLLFDGCNFMQCIEGETQSVDETYARILASRRHTKIIELFDECIASRSFPDWQMGFRRASGQTLQSIAAAKWNLVTPVDAPSSNEPGLTLLREFWIGMR